MLAERLIEIIGSDFYTGVPDSALKGLCDYLYLKFGTDGKHHLIAANEGNCVAVAAGYHLSTGKVPVIYMQNSGEGNIINPVASLLNKDVYGIPAMFIIGWRGEPGIHDEPQHIFQGKITSSLLETMDIPYYVVGRDTNEEEIKAFIDNAKILFSQGKQAALIIKSGAIECPIKANYHNNFTITREEAIRQIVIAAKNDPVIATTGKAGRELYEIRASLDQDHSHDFLTVGSMGHCSSIALGIAINTAKKVWCIDGDGAAIMHMGAMSVIGSQAPDNLVHIVINNQAHESVGGMPTSAVSTDLCAIALSCGYKTAIKVSKTEELKEALNKARSIDNLMFIEINAAIGARSDLGRPKSSPEENKLSFMSFLKDNQ